MTSPLIASIKNLLLLVTFVSLTGGASALAQHSTLKFQRPGQARTPSNSQQFRAPESTTPAVTAAPAKVTQRKVVTQDPRVRQVADVRQPTRTKQPTQELEPIAVAEGEEITYGTMSEELEVPQLMGDGCACSEMGGPCTCETCDCGPGYIGCDPGCGVCDPGCGIVDPGCGVCDPGCGIGDPGCGCPDPGCGGNVCLPGPDYWCVPICFPRLKYLTLWGGVQGFRGPRDFIPNNRSDSNFGFHEGVNIGGRAPLVNTLFPQLSYQLGFQAFQSRLSGTVDTYEDRSQQFITAGLYRRVNSGVQFGAVWDLMNDNLDEDMDLHQVRYEISFKSPRGREIGFLGSAATNDALSNGVNYEAVNQYAGFIRWNFFNGYEARLWGGGTDDSEGILGADFYAPFNDRWALQSGFNYLIPQEETAPDAVRQESWNIGINLVWHLGRTAKRGCRSPYRPLFNVADNGWMFVDQAQ